MPFHGALAGIVQRWIHRSRGVSYRVLAERRENAQAA